MGIEQALAIIPGFGQGYVQGKVARAQYDLTRQRLAQNEQGFQQAQDAYELNRRKAQLEIQRQELELKQAREQMDAQRRVSEIQTQSAQLGLRPEQMPPVLGAAVSPVFGLEVGKDFANVASDAWLSVLGKLPEKDRARYIEDANAEQEVIRKHAERAALLTQMEGLSHVLGMDQSGFDDASGSGQALLGLRDWLAAGADPEKAREEYHKIADAAIADHRVRVQRTKIQLAFAAADKQEETGEGRYTPQQLGDIDNLRYAVGTGSMDLGDAALRLGVIMGGHSDEYDRQLQGAEVKGYRRGLEEARTIYGGRSGKQAAGPGQGAQRVIRDPLAGLPKASEMAPQAFELLAQQLAQVAKAKNGEERWAAIAKEFGVDIADPKLLDRIREIVNPQDTRKQELYDGPQPPWW